MSAAYIWSKPVEFFETDLAGIVHFSNFYRWMESAEHAFLRDRGVLLHQGDLGWPRVGASADFKKPVRFGDVVTVTVEIAELRTRSVRYYFEIGVEGSEDVYATGEMASVCVDLESMKAVEIPDDLRERLPGGA